MPTTNATHRKRLARALSEHSGLSYMAALDQVTKAALEGLLPARLDEPGMQAALRILTTTATGTPAAGAAPSPGLDRPVTEGALDQDPDAPVRRIASDPRDQEIFDLSFEYETLTGKQGLVYITSPDGKADRYVFGEGFTALGRREALDHISTKVADAKLHLTPGGDRYYLTDDALRLLRQVWQGRVTLTRRGFAPTARFAIDDKPASDINHIHLAWLHKHNYLTASLSPGEEWAVARTTDFGDEVLARNGADQDKFVDGLPAARNRPSNTKANTESSASTSAEDLDSTTDRLMGGPYTTAVTSADSKRTTAPRCDVCERLLSRGEQWWLVYSPTRNWENNAGAVCAQHSPGDLPVHEASTVRPHLDQDDLANRVHKARPDKNGEHCAVCMQRIKRVPGGSGPTWVHSDSGAVAAAGPDPEPHQR